VHTYLTVRQLIFYLPKIYGFMAVMFISPHSRLSRGCWWQSRSEGFKFLTTVCLCSCLNSRLNHHKHLKCLWFKEISECYSLVSKLQYQQCQHDLLVPQKYWIWEMIFFNVGANLIIKYRSVILDKIGWVTWAGSHYHLFFYMPQYKQKRWKYLGFVPKINFFVLSLI